jgi:phospholipid transport system substrate-binding protein
VSAVPVVGVAPALSQAAAPASQQAASKFVDDLSVRAFAVLKDKSLTKNAVRAKFRAMLRDNFALDDIGNRLIRRYRSQITPAQYAAYQSALPEFAINAYTDRLYDYSDADVQPVRTLPRGTKGDVDVYSRIVTPGGGAPFDAIWTVRPVGNSWKILNLTVSGINLSLTQESDFSAYIAKNGFDALVAFMKSSNAKAAI